MSHSKIHIIGGGSRPSALTLCSAYGRMYRPVVIASRERPRLSVMAAAVAGSAESVCRTQSVVTCVGSAVGSHARRAVP